MRNLFKSKHKITQLWGVNYDYYKQFGLLGHEGLDLIPTGTQWDVLCLEDGVVVKDIDDATLGKNYGKNVTIWHPTIKKATQYCHLASNSVSNGERVTKGQVIGVMGSTGNTTGAHVHLNLFDVDDNGVRLNRDNGYFGGINPLPFLEEDPSVPEDTLPVKKSDFENLVRKSTIYDKVIAKLNVNDSETVVLGELDKLISYEDAVVQKDSQLQDANKKITYLEGQLKEVSDRNIELGVLNATLTKEVETLTQENKDESTKISFLEGQINDIKATVNRKVFSGWKRTLVDFLAKL